MTELAVEHHHSSSGMGAIIAVIILILFALAFVVFGLPALRGSGAPATDTGNDKNINVAIPDKVDINVNPYGNEGQPAE